MESYAQLTEILGQWARRRQWFNFFHWLPWAGLAALLPALLAALYSRLQPAMLSREIVLLALVSLGMILVFSTIYFFWKRPSLREQARFGDRHFGLRERTVTAVELHKGLLSASAAIRKMQLEETLAAAQLIDTKRDFPWRINRRNWLPFLAAALILATALLFENPQAARLEQSRQIQKSIAQEASALEEMAVAINEQPDLTPREREKMSEPLREAAQQLREGTPSQEEAVAALSGAEEELRTLSQSLAKQEQAQARRNAGERLASSSAGESLGQALMDNDLREAQTAAAELGENLSKLAPADQEALAKALREASSALQEGDPALADTFNRASSSLMEQDLPTAQAALAAAGQNLQQAGRDQAAAAQAASLAAEIAASRQAVAQAGQKAEGPPANPETLQEEGLASQGSTGEGAPSAEDGAGVSAEQAIENLVISGSVAATGVEGQVQNVYVPAPRDLSDAAGVPIELPADCQGDPQACGVLVDESAAEFDQEGSLVPYDQVFTTYRDAANEALAREAIPLRLKDTIHQYFSSLE